MNTNIKTDRLVLKDYTIDHLDELFSIYGDEETMRYYDLFPYKSREEVKKEVDRKDERISNGNGIRWGIFLNNELIGTCGFNYYEKNGWGILGYDLNKSYWGNGYMTEAINAITRYGFSKLEIHRLVAHVVPGNIASEKVLVKCGFELEGLLRHSSYFRGKYQDELQYSKINY